MNEKLFILILLLMLVWSSFYAGATTQKAYHATESSAHRNRDEPQMKTITAMKSSAGHWMYATRPAERSAMDPLQAVEPMLQTRNIGARADRYSIRLCRFYNRDTKSEELKLFNVQCPYAGPSYGEKLNFIDDLGEVALTGDDNDMIPLHMVQHLDTGSLAYHTDLATLTMDEDHQYMGVLCWGWAVPMETEADVARACGFGEDLFIRFNK